AGLYTFLVLFIELQGQFSLFSCTTFHVVPNRLQHFQFESVSFHCEGLHGSTQFRGIRKTEEFTSECNIKRTSEGSSCTIDRVYPGDSGAYWCETQLGHRSNVVNITVTGSPVLPVMEGDALTLRCLTKKTSSDVAAGFYKDGLHIGSSSTGEMILHSVSDSDEGLYKCHISGIGESPQSWLAVRGKHLICFNFSMQVTFKENVQKRNMKSLYKHKHLQVVLHRLKQNMHFICKNGENTTLVVYI
uniref:Ig-like domain-containing protein n=1 Tax=Acanthochromis polyacanthus TaxID=80966 RepID=A0A3Q1F305_9TELE